MPLVPTPAVVQPPAQTIELYTVKYATAKELSEILGKLMPEVTVVLGPQPKYIRDALPTEAMGNAAGAQRSMAMPDIKDVSDQFVRFLVLKGDPDKVKAALALLARLDLPAPQVTIEAHILDITEGARRAIGVSYDLSPNGNTGKFTLDTPKSQGTFPEMVFGRLTRDPIQFNAALEAAIQQNRARLLASPKLTVLYNQRARIFIGDEVNYLSGAQASPSGTTLTTGKVNVGVELNVTAVGNPDGTITMKVNPEVGSLIALDTLPNGVTLPRIARRLVQTAVRMRDGETLVLGGLIGETELRSLKKLPILGDLPVLGQLFRFDSRQKDRSELVILLKATIVKETQPAGVQ